MPHTHSHRHRKRRRGLWVVGALVVLALAVGVALAVDGGLGGREEPGGAEDDRAAVTGPPTRTESPRATASGRQQAGADAPITLRVEAYVVRRLASVALSGSFPDGPAGTRLRVQARLVSEEWLTYPVPTVVGEDGEFRTWIELDRRGPTQLRMVAPAGGQTSNVVTVDVR